MQKKYRQFDLFADLYDENENVLHTAVDEAVEKSINNKIKEDCMEEKMNPVCDPL